MEIGVTLFITLIVVTAIWVLVELRRFRHKIFAIFLIVLIIFLYVTVSYVFKHNSVDIKTVPGVIKGTQLYFSWLGSAFNNLKFVTTNAVKMNWGSNSSR